MITAAVSVALLVLLCILSLNVLLQLLCAVVQARATIVFPKSAVRRVAVQQNATGVAACPRPELISIHVPVHAEPPEIVIDTLNALAALNDEDYEVIVVDNNTADPGLWRPVEVHCRRLGPAFRFTHREGVVGAKAGALRIARSMSRSDARYIAVIDADYQVEPHFLERCREIVSDKTIAFVQFPQAYRMQHPFQVAMAAELDDYFRRQASFAERSGTMLLTGTLSIIATDALDAAGGWPIATITEDADLGSRLVGSGFTGRFVDEIVGRGLLPPSFSELVHQRSRWTRGNMQVVSRIVRHQPRLLLRWGVLAQLMAWSNFLAIPALVLVLVPLAGLFHGSSQTTARLISLAALGVLVQGLVTIGAFILSQTRLSGPRLLPSVIRWSLSVPTSLATLQGILGGAHTFRCTRRFAQKAPVGSFVTGWGVGIGILIIAGASWSYHTWYTLSALSLVVLALVLPTFMRVMAQQPRVRAGTGKIHRRTGAAIVKVREPVGSSARMYTLIGQASVKTTPR